MKKLSEVFHWFELFTSSFRLFPYFWLFNSITFNEVTIFCLLLFSLCLPSSIKPYELLATLLVSTSFKQEWIFSKKSILIAVLWSFHSPGKYWPLSFINNISRDTCVCLLQDCEYHFPLVSYQNFVVKGWSLVTRNSLALDKSLSVL